MYQVEIYGRVRRAVDMARRCHVTAWKTRPQCSRHKCRSKVDGTVPANDETVAKARKGGEEMNATNLWEAVVVLKVSNAPEVFWIAFITSKGRKGHFMTTSDGLTESKLRAELKKMGHTAGEINYRI